MSDNSLLDPFDKQKPPRNKSEKLYLICPHCGLELLRETYLESAYGDFDCPRCGAYRHSMEFASNEARPGYFIRKIDAEGVVIENYVTQAEWDEYQQRMAMLGKRIILTIIKDIPQMPGEKPALPEGDSE